MKKNLFVLLMLLLVVTANLCALQVKAKAKKTNIRQKPDLKSSVLFKADQGTLFEVQEKKASGTR